MYKKDLSDCLADCFGFLDIATHIESGIRSYIFMTEHWHSVNKLLQKVYKNYNDLAPLLKSVELVFFEIPRPLSGYMEFKKHGIPLDRPMFRKAKMDFEDYFNDFAEIEVLESPILIHNKIQNTSNPKEIRFLFAFYLAHLSGFSNNPLALKVVGDPNEKIGRSNKNSIETRPYNVKAKGHRFPDTLLDILKLAELSIKIRKYNYSLELEKLDYILRNNFELLHSYLEYKTRKNITHQFYDKSYDIYDIPLEDILGKSLKLLSKSIIYTDAAEFSELKLLHNLVAKIQFEEPNLEFDTPKVEHFRCILFERAKNAFRYGLISHDKFMRYEKKLKGVEKEQFTKVREYLKNLNYLTPTDRPPAIRNNSWSVKNTEFYENEIKPALEAEEIIELDFSLHLYRGYLDEYFKKTALKAYKTSDYNILLEKGHHLKRLYKRHDSDFTSANLVKGMLLDSRSYKEYEEFTKWDLEETNTPTGALREIASVQNELDNVLNFSAKLLLSLAYWERKKKTIDLFRDEIEAYLNSYIVENNYQRLPLKLLDKYTDIKYIKSNYEKLTREWLEEPNNSYDKFPFSKKEIIEELEHIKPSFRKYESGVDIYRERFDLIRRRNGNVNFNHIAIPKVKISFAIWEFIKLDLLKIFRDQLTSFKKEHDIQIGDDRWVSEKHLYFKIKEEYPEVVVLRHASPTWLGKQHFDIYMPAKKVAIEYNGRQHYEPIDYFGGKKAFEHRKELDRKKLKKADENNVTVLIHKYNSDLEDILNELESHINS